MLSWKCQKWKKNKFNLPIWKKGNRKIRTSTLWQYKHVDDFWRLSLNLHLLALILIWLLADKISTTSKHSPNILTFLSFSLPSLIVTRASTVRSKGILPVCCCCCRVKQSVTTLILACQCHTKFCYVLMTLVAYRQWPFT